MLRTGLQFMEDKKYCDYDYVLLGETFYIQLFIDWNLLKTTRILVCEDKKIFWSDKIEIVDITINDIDKEHDKVIFCGFDKRMKEKYALYIDYDFFDINTIKENGTFLWNRRRYIVDDVKYVASNPEYMKRAYPNINCSCLKEYLQELSKAPAGRTVDGKGQICLWDYNGKYIHQQNGRRVTYNVKDENMHSIHVFGDSRVSGYMLADSDLFTNILQKQLNQGGIQYNVINYGIPGREIDRMEYQVKKAKLKPEDIVLVLTGCYEYRDNAIEKLQQFALHLNRIKGVCDKKDVKFCYINLPVTVEMMPLNPDEKTIVNIYRNYKFSEYTYEIVEHYKKILFMLIQEYGILYHDLAIDFNKERDNLFFINMHHYSPEGNKIMADVILRLVEMMQMPFTTIAVNQNVSNAFKIIKKYVYKEKRKHGLLRRTRISFGIHDFRIREICFRIRLWIRAIFKEAVYKKGINGAIVMNANPFTLGHRYLVEYASSKVEHLYVFVLEEDKSEITYADRLRMVYYGCKDIKNVTVTSGGNSIISSETFPEYFMKKELQNEEIDAFKDIERFALDVAPINRIQIRFVGEEPFDKVTKQYNEQMKKFLPQYGIAVVEIPRKVNVEGVISASKVRNAIKKDDWDLVAQMVPPSTLKYLKKMKISI